MYSFATLLIRASVYMLIIISIGYLFTMEGYLKLTASTYSEHSLTEYLHDGLALCCCVIFLFVAKSNRQLKLATITLSSLMGVMFIREFDGALDHYVFDGAWQFIVLLIVIFTSVKIKNSALSLKESLLAYSNTTSAGIFFSGLMILIVFSRLIGQGSFWLAVMGDNFLRVVKNIAEEGTELLGYAIILISALELVWYNATLKARPR